MAVIELIQQQLLRMQDRNASDVDPDTLISSVVDSHSFLTLLLSLEKALNLTVSDEAFYESAPVTFGQLAEFLSREGQKGSQSYEQQL